MIAMAWNNLVGAWSGLNASARAALAAWVLSMIVLPVVKWAWGDRAMRWGVTLSVVSQAVTVVAVLGHAWGWRQTALVALAIAGMGWAVEFVGSRTGFPFGRYHYTDRLQPQLGRVPLLIPLAWLMMIPPAWAIADRVAGQRGLAFVAVSALAFTAWDLFLDPQMVGWRLWIWERPGGYFGIPWVNYLGWALASAVMTAVLRPRSLPTEPLQLIYAITWLMETVGLGVFWGQPRPALVGFLCMGGMMFWAWFLKA